MYFSVIVAAPGREADAAQEWAGGPFAEHEWLWKCVCGAPEITPDFLFRRWDIDAAPRIFALTVQKPLPQNPVWGVTTREYAPRLAPAARLHFHLRANPTVNETRDGRSQRQDVVTREKLRLLAERGFGSWEQWHGADKPSLQTLVHDTCCDWLRGRAARHGFEVHDETFRAEHYTQHEQDDSRTQLVDPQRHHTRTTTNAPLHGSRLVDPQRHHTRTTTNAPLHGSRLVRQRGESGVPFSTVDLGGELTVVDPVTFAFALQRGIGRAKPFGCGMLLLDEEVSRART